MFACETQNISKETLTTLHISLYWYFLKLRLNLLYKCPWSWVAVPSSETMKPQPQLLPSPLLHIFISIYFHHYLNSHKCVKKPVYHQSWNAKGQKLCKIHFPSNWTPFLAPEVKFCQENFCQVLLDCFLTTCWLSVCCHWLRSTWCIQRLLVNYRCCVTFCSHSNFQRPFAALN